MENLFYRFVLFVCKFWQARDFAPTVARINATRWDISTSNIAFIRDIGVCERTHGANKCIYRQILNKK